MDDDFPPCDGPCPPVLISRDVLQMAADWKRIKKHTVHIPPDKSAAMDRAILDSMNECPLVSAEELDAIGREELDRRRR